MVLGDGVVVVVASRIVDDEDVVVRGALEVVEVLEAVFVLIE